MNISVLLSTYNGEEYIEEQINSLFKQTVKEFEIIARDDNSKDNSLKKIESLGITLIKSDKNLGAQQSFNQLLQHAKKNPSMEYFLFCDQDDIWREDKIEKALKKIRELEEDEKNAPILIHSDLEVVDNSLNTINSSFWKYENIDPNKNSLNRLLLQNTITGCSVLINRQLAELTTIPKNTIMHDWWLGLVTTKFGKIGILDEALIKYRQHKGNEIGATNYSLKNIVLKAFTILKDPNKSFNIDKNILQAKEFLSQFENKLSSKDKEMLETFINIKNKNKLQRVHTLIKYKIYKQGFLRNLGLFLTI